MRKRGTVGVFPAYADNPYVNLLGLAARARGYAFVDSTSLEALERAAAGLGPGDALHVHWTAPIVQRAETTASATDRFERFRRAVDGAAGRGAVVLWTIHNVLPHDPRHEAVELELCRYLAARADVVHALTDDIVSVTAEFYAVDQAKVVVIPHPSYQGVYPSELSRADARRGFELADDERAILFFGQMRPYKGLDVLLEAVGESTAATPDGYGRPVVLLAGRTSEQDRVALEALLPAGVSVVRHHEHVADADVQRWFRAADVVVLPYRRILNSGTLHLAATFGVPVILPDEEHLRRAFGAEEWISWFDPSGGAAALRAALAPSPSQAAAAAGPLPDAAALAFSHRLAPFALSERYADLLDSRLAPAPAPAR